MAAKRLASLTGRSLTDAVIEALEARLAAIQKDHAQQERAKRSNVENVLQEIWASLPPKAERPGSKALMDTLYDENGLPV